MTKRVVVWGTSVNQKKNNIIIHPLDMKEIAQGVELNQKVNLHFLCDVGEKGGNFDVHKLTFANRSL